MWLSCFPSIIVNQKLQVAYQNNAEKLRNFLDWCGTKRRWDLSWTRFPDFDLQIQTSIMGPSGWKKKSKTKCRKCIIKLVVASMFFCQPLQNHAKLLVDLVSKFFYFFESFYSFIYLLSKGRLFNSTLWNIILNERTTHLQAFFIPVATDLLESPEVCP